MKTYRLHRWWLLPFSALALFFVWQLQPLTAFAVPGRGSAWLWLWSLLPLLTGGMAYAAWRPFSRQPKLLPAIAFTFACTVCFAVLLAGRIVQDQHELALAQALQQARQGMQGLQQTRAESIRTTAQFTQPGDRFERHRNRLSAEELAWLIAIDERHHTRLQRVADLYREVLASHDFSGPEQWVRIASRSLLDEERAQYLRLFEASRAFLQVVETLEAQYLADIAAHELSETARLVAIAELERVLLEFRATDLLRIRQLDVALTETSLELLDHLRLSWGRWQLDTAESRLRFDRVEEEWRFFDLLQTLTQLMELQTR